MNEKDKLINLLAQFVALVKFHEIEHDDEHARSLLLQAEEFLSDTDSQEFLEWVESVRVANICGLSP